MAELHTQPLQKVYARRVRIGVLCRRYVTRHPRLAFVAPTVSNSRAANRLALSVRLAPMPWAGAHTFQYLRGHLTDEFDADLAEDPHCTHLINGLREAGDHGDDGRPLLSDISTLGANDLMKRIPTVVSPRGLAARSE